MSNVLAGIRPCEHCVKAPLTVHSVPRVWFDSRALSPSVKRAGVEVLVSTKGCACVYVRVWKICGWVRCKNVGV